MSYNFQKWYYFWLFVLFLACAPDRDEFISYNQNTNTRLEIADLEGLSFENSNITDGTEFNFKTQTAGQYTLEIRDHFKTLISKSIINAQVGDNVLNFYTKALQDGDYFISINKENKVVQETKMTIQ
jgi:hypothetical protein|tara:strand:+ start:432 stop:812 length:381 start_codon:yes stop_codon:yes gene_type:complete